MQIKPHYKDPHLEKQLKQSSMVLQQIVYDFVAFSIQEFGIIPTVTRLWDAVKGESGVHPDKRGCDIRNEYVGQFVYSPWQSERLLQFINTKWKRNDGYFTCIHHSFNGGPMHFHLQIPLSTKAYEVSDSGLENVT